MTALTRPANPTNNVVNYLAVLLSCCTVWWCYDSDIRGLEAALWVLAAFALPVLAYEVFFMRTPWNPSTGLTREARAVVPHRVAIKLIGLLASFGFVALLYWLFPEYHGPYYNVYWETIELFAPYVVVLSVPYFFYMDAHQKDPYDSYYYFGKCVLMDFESVSSKAMVQHVLGWVVKGFFLPLMFVGFVGNVNHAMNIDYERAFEHFRAFFQMATHIMYTVDLLAAVCGYALAIRLFDTHIRSSEPTLLGWVICVMCYQPFLTIFMRNYLNYGPGSWLGWLDDSPAIRVIWGSTALFCLVVYTLASVNFGCRFSNLTHRGVLTTGMYRFTKHPAYVSKNLFWWLTFVPFIPVNEGFDALRYTILVAGISGVYYLRARTEERHLSRDPVYVQYALYMNEHSIFRGLAHYLPFLKYKPPAGWEQQASPYMGIK
jgi:Protein of unknown function (DUF1295)